MSDSGIKKARVLEENLPPVNIYAQGNIVRYRIISEDQNRTSSWSPTRIVKPEYTFVSGSMILTKSGSSVSVLWDPVKISKNSVFIKNAKDYDVWIRWHRNDGGDWIYSERSISTNTSLVIPTSYRVGGVLQGSAPNRLDVEIYLKGFPISRDATYLKVYTETNKTV